MTLNRFDRILASKGKEMSRLEEDRKDRKKLIYVNIDTGQWGGGVFAGDYRQKKKILYLNTSVLFVSR